MAKGPSLTMAMATGVALLCYAVLLFVPVHALARRREPGDIQLEANGSVRIEPMDRN
jgi:hypothetical protein